MCIRSLVRCCADKCFQRMTLKKHKSTVILLGVITLIFNIISLCNVAFLFISYSRNCKSQPDSHECYKIIKNSSWIFLYIKFGAEIILLFTIACFVFILKKIANLDYVNTVSNLIIGIYLIALIMTLIFRFTCGYAISTSCSSSDDDKFCKYRKSVFLFEVLLIIVTLSLTIMTTFSTVGASSY